VHGAEGWVGDFYAGGLGVLTGPGLPPPFGYGRTADAASPVRSYHRRTQPTLVGPVTGGDAWV